MEPDKLIWEARARIIWGDSLESVRQFLISKGISSTVADLKIKGFILEKKAGLRRDGIREILGGATLLAASGGVLLWVVVRGLLISWFAYFPTSAGILVCIGIYGVWKLIKGVISLVESATGRKRKEPADNSQFDDFSNAGANLNQTTNVENENYSILGLTPPCSLDELKAAYRQCIKDCHPDRFTTETPEFRQWAEERAKVINAAYEALLNELGNN